MSDKVLIDRELLKELVSSLEGEVESRYSNGIKEHPAMKRDYECDIEPVIRGKELLAAAPAAPAAQAEPVATVVERKEGSRTWFDGVIHATAIVMEQIKDGDPLYVAQPAQPDAALVEALKELVSAVRSINRSRHHQIQLPADSEPVYWQRREWIDWILGLADSADAALAGKGGE